MSRDLHRILVLLAAASIALATLPWFASDFMLSLALTCLLYVGLAVSWSMFSGATNYLSLATSAFFGIGAYVTAWGFETLPYALVVPLGGLVAAAFAALVGAAVLHLRGAYFAVLTFGLGELVRHAITYAEKTYAKTVGRVIAEPPDSIDVYLTVLLLAFLTVAVCAAVRASRFGLALAGIGSDEERAQTLGVNTRRTKILAFALAAFFAGRAGRGDGGALDLHRARLGVQSVHRLPDRADRHDRRRADADRPDRFGGGVQRHDRAAAAAVSLRLPDHARACC